MRCNERYNSGPNTRGSTAETEPHFFKNYIIVFLLCLRIFINDACFFLVIRDVVDHGEGFTGWALGKMLTVQTVQCTGAYDGK